MIHRVPVDFQITEKQRRYLRWLGYTGELDGMSRGHASKLIAEFRTEKAVLEIAYAKAKPQPP